MSWTKAASGAKKASGWGALKSKSDVEPSTTAPSNKVQVKKPIERPKETEWPTGAAETEWPVVIEEDDNEAAPSSSAAYGNSYGGYSEGGYGDYSNATHEWGTGQQWSGGSAWAPASASAYEEAGRVVNTYATKSESRAMTPPPAYTEDDEDVRRAHDARAAGIPPTNARSKHQNRTQASVALDDSTTNTTTTAVAAVAARASGAMSDVAISSTWQSATSDGSVHATASSGHGNWQSHVAPAVPLTWSLAASSQVPQADNRPPLPPGPPPPGTPSVGLPFLGGPPPVSMPRAVSAQSAMALAPPAVTTAPWNSHGSAFNTGVGFASFGDDASTTSKAQLRSSLPAQATKALPRAFCVRAQVELAAGGEGAVLSLSSLPSDLAEPDMVLKVLAALGAAAVQLTHSPLATGWFVKLRSSEEAARVAALLDMRSHQLLRYLTANHAQLITQRPASGALPSLLDNASDDEPISKKLSTSASKHRSRRVLVTNLPPEASMQAVSDFVIEALRTGGGGGRAISEELVATGAKSLHVDLQCFEASEGCAVVSFGGGDLKPSDESALLAALLDLDGRVEMPFTNAATSESSQESIAVLPVDPTSRNTMEVHAVAVDMGKGWDSAPLDVKELETLKQYLAIKSGCTPKELKSLSGAAVKVLFPTTTKGAAAAARLAGQLNGASVPGLAARPPLRCHRLVALRSSGSSPGATSAASGGGVETSWTALALGYDQAISLLASDHQSSSAPLLRLSSSVEKLFTHVLVTVKDSPHFDAASLAYSPRDASGAAAFLTGGAESQLSGRKVWLCYKVIDAPAKRYLLPPSSKSCGIFLKLAHGAARVAVPLTSLAPLGAFPPEDFSRWLLAAQLADRGPGGSGGMPSAVREATGRQTKAHQLRAALAKAPSQLVKDFLAPAGGGVSAEVSVARVKEAVAPVTVGRGRGKQATATAPCNEMMALGGKKRDRRTAQQVLRDTESKAAELRQPKQTFADDVLLDVPNGEVAIELDGSDDDDSTNPRAPLARILAAGNTHGGGGWGAGLTPHDNGSGGWGDGGNAWFGDSATPAAAHEYPISDGISQRSTFDSSSSGFNVGGANGFNNF